MYLKKSYRKDSGRTYLVIAQKYRNPKTGTSTDRSIESLGYLDDLEKIYDDPIAHFRKVAKEMTIADDKEKHMTLNINTNERLEKDTDNKKNFGYAAPLKLYHELELDRFFNNKARGEDFKFNTNSIMILLFISRLLYPGSKKKAFEDKHKYFERFKFSIDDMYHALTHFSNISKEFQQYLHDQITAKYGYDTKIIYYDVTNYYFEIHKPDDLRKFGKPKQNRKKPVVQMGLAMDSNGIPLHYELFPGNTLDKQTFRTVIGEVKRHYNTGRIVVVADMGIITGDNIYYLTGGNQNKPLNGYVFSFTVRGGADIFKSYVLDETGYTEKDGAPVTKASTFKIKSRIIARDINVSMKSGKKKTKVVYEKQVIFWGKKYCDKARAERDEIVKKAQNLIANPTKYNKATSYGAAAYVKNIEFDKSTGEILDTGNIISFNSEKLKEEEKYDGYYAIVTSELEMSESDIIDTYRGLWEIEETFKITKSDLKNRPVYVSTENHIDAHFLTCFLTLVILRLIQKKTDKKYSAADIIDALKNITCSLEQDNIFLFDYRSEISDAIGEAFGIDFTYRRRTLGEIKKIIGETKK